MIINHHYGPWIEGVYLPPKESKKKRFVESIGSIGRVCFVGQLT